MIPPKLLDWQWQLDNPTFLGWSVVAVYLLSATACVLAVRASRRAAPPSQPWPVWGCLAAGLAFLGVNKQLNLQTFMIVLGRRAAVAGDWYDDRRLVQAVFAGIFGLIVASILFVFYRNWRRFFLENRLASCGLVTLAMFVLIRSSTINHLDHRLGVKLHDDRWCWILEMCGSALIALSALRSMRLSSAT